MGALTQADQAIMTVIKQIVTDWTAYPLFVEPDNETSLDQAAQTNPWLQVSIRQISGSQMDLADRPRVQQLGQILLSAVVKDGAGRQGAKALLDFCTPYFDMKDLGIVRTHAFEATAAKALNGWYYAPAIVPFWFDRISGS